MDNGVRIRLEVIAIVSGGVVCVGLFLAMLKAPPLAWGIPLVLGGVVCAVAVLARYMPRCPYCDTPIHPYTGGSFCPRCGKEIK